MLGKRCEKLPLAILVWIFAVACWRWLIFGRWLIPRRRLLPGRWRRLIPRRIPARETHRYKLEKGNRDDNQGNDKLTLHVCNLQKKAMNA